MYLESASCVDEIVCYGVVPAIEFLDLAMDERENGNDERAAMLETEAKAKLYKVRERLEAIQKERKAD